MKYLLFIMIALAAMSCGSSATSDPVAKAAAALAAGNEKACQKACDDLLADTAAFNGLSATQLCRMAEMYVLLSGEPGANDGAAVRCLNRARTLSTDSVDNFLSSCSPEGASQLTTLYYVGSYLEIPRDSLVGSEDEPYIESSHVDSTLLHHNDIK